jgi:drug/metabolite transporter (DMT)-like permease
VSTIVMSLLILGEPMGPWQVAGTAMVMLGVFVVTRPAKQAVTGRVGPRAAR